MNGREALKHGRAHWADLVSQGPIRCLQSDVTMLCFAMDDALVRATYDLRESGVPTVAKKLVWVVYLSQAQWRTLDPVATMTTPRGTLYYPCLATVSHPRRMAGEGAADHLGFEPERPEPTVSFEVGTGHPGVDLLDVAKEEVQQTEKTKKRATEKTKKRATEKTEKKETMTEKAVENVVLGQPCVWHLVVDAMYVLSPVDVPLCEPDAFVPYVSR